ncbi:hypothetical protein SAMN05444920_109265 [Nonomuraea solani]|uniref:DUF3558 domain-containing protein n=1 Tax=Nonomuraea solani TaxID=1144553 RepID=A0A1H6EGE5_9ACTN|nr:hypothetical protein [Nonomuraea solani]SEG96056.1 hypothetical protein SAMN05444920_109265 [Nonomuraea solani]
MRTALTLLLAATLAGCAATPSAAPTPTAAAVSQAPAPVAPDRLRPITGAQVCAAVPKSLRVSLLPEDMFTDDVNWSNNVATATVAWGECNWHRGAPRSLSVIVQAYGTVTQTATEHAKQLFDKSKAEAATQAEKPDRRAYTPPVTADHGDAAYRRTVTETSRSGSRDAEVVIRQGPWLITITYRGEERDGALPAEAELRRGADRFAEVFTAEMAKDPSTVAPDGDRPCGAISATDVTLAFFPSVTEVGGNGDADQTACTWEIRDGVVQADRPCGRGVMRLGDIASRCGQLRIHVSDARRLYRRDLKAQFDFEAGHYAKEVPIKRLTGLGDRAFAVAQEVRVLAGDRLIRFTYDGTNVGGGPRDAPGYQKPDLDEAALRKSLIRTARSFVSGLSAHD